MAKNDARMIPPGSIHLVKDTEHGPESLCGCDAAVAVYEGELNQFPFEAICPTCKRLRKSDRRFQQD